MSDPTQLLLRAQTLWQLTRWTDLRSVAGELLAREPNNSESPFSNFSAYTTASSMPYIIRVISF